MVLWLWPNGKSVMEHITNSHTNFADPLYSECAHGPLAQNYEWIEPGELNVLKCLNYVVIVRAMFVKVLVWFFNYDDQSRSHLPIAKRKNSTHGSAD